MLTRRQFVRLSTASAGISVLAGCSPTIPRLAVPEPLLDQAEIAGFNDIRFWGDEQPDNLERLVHTAMRQRKMAASGTPDAPSNFLAVSGGGSDGAYGAGLLSGWSASGKRPSFDIVTGVSTGALISPFAFLGSRYDRQLSEIYTQYSTRDILTLNVVGGLLGGSALGNAAPFEKLIARYITQDLLAAVAERHRSGRRLLVGTTNFDAQRPVIWDMGAIAQSNRTDALGLFRKILQASASIPGAFPPVRLNVNVNGKTYDELHVDGGVTAQVFFLPSQIMLRSLASAPVLPQAPKLYVIRNGQISPQYQVVNAKLADIAERSISTIIKTQANGELAALYARSIRDGLDYQLSHIPSSFTVKSKEVFDRRYMNALYKTGYAAGLRGGGWDQKPPGMT